MAGTPVGQLRQRITIQERQITGLDAEGHPLTAWVTLEKCWAKIEPLTGREKFAAQQIRPETTHRVVRRFREGITPQMRILHQGSRILEIDSAVATEERPIELILWCKEVL